MGSLTGWDWFVVLTALVSTLFGAWTGFVRTACALLAWVGGVLAAPYIAPKLGSLGGAPAWVALVVAFLLAYLAVRLFGALLARVMRGVGLGGVDRGAGALLGVARAGAVIGVIAWIASMAGFHRSEAWRSAATRPIIERLVAGVAPLAGKAAPADDDPLRTLLQER